MIRQSKSLGPTIFVDNAILVLLKRMAEISRLIGLATLLIAIPLLAIAWMLASNLSSLLILNERRKLGLMRLRGVPGKLLGQSLLISIGLGGLIGGIIGLTLGTLIPLYVYEGGVLSWTTLSRVQGPLADVVVLDRRVSVGPADQPQADSLCDDDFTARGVAPRGGVGTDPSAQRFRCAGMARALDRRLQDCRLDRRLQFVVASRRRRGRQRGVDSISFKPRPCSIGRSISSPCRFSFTVWSRCSSRSAQLISGLLSSVTYFVGGKLRTLSLKHMSLKPHRISSFLLIVGLMASVSLYPSIASKSFEDKALRGATVQVGSELHVSISPTDLVSAEQFEQGLGGQVQAIRSALKERLASFQHPTGNVD